MIIEKSRCHADSIKFFAYLVNVNNSGFFRCAYE